MAEKSIPNHEVPMTDNGRPDPARSDAPGTADLVSHESRFATEYDGMTERELFRSVLRSIEDWRREHRDETRGDLRQLCAEVRELGYKFDDIKVTVGDLAHQINLSDRDIY